MDRFEFLMAALILFGFGAMAGLAFLAISDVYSAGFVCGVVR
uniref:Uncharacterized protein n=3 Tax=unclassified bacterial viruses TaxID=12333 RepID=A0AAU6W2P6_9VIRU